MKEMILLKQAETVEAGRVIGMDHHLLLDLGIQLISTVLLIVIIVMMIKILALGIKALKLYIKKNS